MKKILLLSILAINVAFGQSVTLTPNSASSSEVVKLKKNGIGIDHSDATGVVRLGTFVSGSGAYIQTHSNHSLNFATNNGTSQLTLLTTGQFGIGTNTPTDKLTVQTTTNSTGITQTDGTASLSTYIGTPGGGTLGGWFGTKSNHPLYLYTNNAAPSVTLLQSGNLGIGSTNPTATLVVARGTGVNGTAQFIGTTNSSHFNYSTNETTYIRGGKASSEVIINDVSGGNIRLAEGGGSVGIGVASPSAKLDILQNENTFSTPALNITESGNGSAITISNTNATNVYKTLSATSNGVGYTIFGENTGTGYAGSFVVNNASSSGAALYATSNGTGFTMNVQNTGTGDVANFSTNSNTGNVVKIVQNGSGNSLFVVYGGGGTSSTTNRNLAVFSNSSSNLIRFDNTGKGFFNGGTQSSGADVAESFDIVGSRNSYEAGDVLVISASTDRTVEKCSEPYSVLVAGVFATKPGVLLTPTPIDNDISQQVPMGVIGVIPTKVCNEGGSIKRGDLLVTSSKVGYAMKADRSKLQIGQAIGKALQDFDGEKGKIEVLVNIR